MVTYASVQRSGRRSRASASSPRSATRTSAFRDALLDGRSRHRAGHRLRHQRLPLDAGRRDPRISSRPTWVPPMKLRRLDRTGVYALAPRSWRSRTRGVASPRRRRRSTSASCSARGPPAGSPRRCFSRRSSARGPTGAPALLFDSTVGNSAASLAALEFKLRGPTSRSARRKRPASRAIATAVDLLREGRAAALLAGGVDAVYETFFKAHDRFGVMSPAAQFSHAAARRSTPTARGFVLGEGGFALWLERATRARAVATARFSASSMSSAAVPVNAWPIAPSRWRGRCAWRIDDAGLTPADVDVVYASANATTALDASRRRRWREVFGERGRSSRRSRARSASPARRAAPPAPRRCCAARRAGAADCRAVACRHRRRAALQSGPRGSAAPGPIALVNSFASGGALFSVVLRVARCEHDHDPLLRSRRCIRTTPSSPAASPSSPAARAASAGPSSRRWPQRGAAVGIAFREREEPAREVEAAIAAQRRPRRGPGTATSAAKPAVDAFVDRGRRRRSARSTSWSTTPASRATRTSLFLDTRAMGRGAAASICDAAYHCVRAVVRGMLLRRWGRIINVSSPSARMPLPGQAGYAASKAGLEGLDARAVARPGGQGRAGQRRVAGPDRDRDARDDAGRDARGATSRPSRIGRAGRPSEVARARRVSRVGRRQLHHRTGDRRRRRPAVRNAEVADD